MDENNQRIFQEWSGPGLLDPDYRDEEMRRGRTPFGRLASGLMILLLMTWILPSIACSLTDDPGRDRASSLPEDLEVDRQSAVFLSGGQPRTLDPALTRGSAGGPIGAIFSGLVTLDPDLQIQPELAAGWDVSEDRTIYTFYLRPEARFHDGRPLTAEDVVFSWERAANPSTGSDTAQTYLGDIIGVQEVIDGKAERISGLKVLDDHTLEVHIDAPKVYFLSKLTYPVAYVVDRQNVTLPGWEHAPNGSGAFKLQEWEDDAYLVLARNEAYYLTRPAIQHIVYLIGAGIPLSMYEKNEIDLVGVGGSDLDRLQDPNSPYYPELQVGVDMCTSFVTFNNKIPPFNDQRVRQAFSYAIDRERLVEGLYLGDAMIADGPLPPGMPGYSGDLTGLRHDPEKASRLMAEAGYGDPAAFPVVTFNTAGYGSAGAFVTALITMWQETLGVTVEPVLLDPYVYLDELYQGNTGNIFTQGWCADYPDPENFMDVLFHSQSRQNLGGYEDSEVDLLLEQARIEPDVRGRMDQYGTIEQQIVEDAPSVFLTHSLSAVLVKPRVENYVLSPIGVAQWHLVRLDS